MTLVNVGFALNGAKVYSMALELAAHDAEDMHEPLADIGDDLLQHVGMQFASEGAADQQPWAPLDGKYLTRKEARYPGAPILVRTGQMRRMMLDRSSVEIRGNTMTYEPKSEIAIFHQKGTRRGLPSRPMIVVDESARRRWNRIILSWVRHVERRVIGL